MVKKTNHNNSTSDLTAFQELSGCSLALVNQCVPKIEHLQTGFEYSFVCSIRMHAFTTRKVTLLCIVISLMTTMATFGRPPASPRPRPPSRPRDFASGRPVNAGRESPGNAVRAARDDWQNLLEVFPETKSRETAKFRDYIRRCQAAGRVVPHNQRDFYSAPITVNGKGDIVGIDLHHQQLTHHSIGDLSKLPPTLLTLQLSGNNFGEIDVAMLPRGLEHLGLSATALNTLNVAELPRTLKTLDIDHNRLADLDLTNLPPAMEELSASYNGLTSVDLSNLSQRLRKVYLDHNELRQVDLSMLSRLIRILVLDYNYLKVEHFMTLPDDGRRTKVTGIDEQKGINTP